MLPFPTQKYLGITILQSKIFFVFDRKYQNTITSGIELLLSDKEMSYSMINQITLFRGLIVYFFVWFKINNLNCGMF